MAEAWLTDHRKCEFPWPFNRDLRHHRASLPGAELVGFAGEAEENTCFAFGQVKTSKEKQSPPQVVNRGGKSLVGQMLQLRDDKIIKNTIVNYLAYRAQAGGSWVEKFRAAAIRFFNSGAMEIVLFGVLIRDVEPVGSDLAGAAVSLRDGCPPSSRIELCALYLPSDSIPEGSQHRPRQQRRAKT